MPRTYTSTKLTLTSETALNILQGSIYARNSKKAFTDFFTINFGIGRLYMLRGQTYADLIEKFVKIFISKLRELFRRIGCEFIWTATLEGDCGAIVEEWRKDAHMHFLLHVPDRIRHHKEFTTNKATKATIQALIDRTTSAMGLKKPMVRSRSFFNRATGTRSRGYLLDHDRVGQDEVRYYRLIFYILKTMNDGARRATMMDEFFEAIYYGNEEDRPKWTFAEYVDRTRIQKMSLHHLSPKLNKSKHEGPLAPFMDGETVSNQPYWDKLKNDAVRRKEAMRAFSNESSARIQNLQTRLLKKKRTNCTK